MEIAIGLFIAAAWIALVAIGIEELERIWRKIWRKQ